MINTKTTGPSLAGPPPHPGFIAALDGMVAAAKRGHRKESPFFNPGAEWLIANMRILQDMPEHQREQVLQEGEQVLQEAAALNAEGKAAARAWADAVVRLDTGGLAFFSQLGVARRPDLTHYLIDGFPRNRDGLAFSTENQAVFAEVLPYITEAMERHFDAGDVIVQTDRQLGDAPGRTFHARQVLFGSHYLQLPYMWRQLTFDLPDDQLQQEPDILEVSLPNWLQDLGLPQELKDRIQKTGLTSLVFKAPTKGLSLHLGFDYVGEHKMGPLSIAMHLVKQRHGVALQAALSMARVKTLDGAVQNTAMVTTGPSLHGKSTLTIMLELADSDLSRLLGLTPDPDEAIYPMNDDIILLQPLATPIEHTRGGWPVRIPYGIDGTENNLYAVPVGLSQDTDPITYDVLRGSKGTPNPQETLENVPVQTSTGAPDFFQNPVRNMRMVLSRSRLLERKGVSGMAQAFGANPASDLAHVPMEVTDRVLWQGVMRQNTVVPPLVRLTQEQYIRALMYGEAVQTGAAPGAIGRPYVEYFSDPFIIGLEDENANLLHTILGELAAGGLPQEYYMFNTGGVGADGNAEASGPHYKKITRELTLLLQEAVLRGAIRFEHDPDLGMDVAVAIVDQRGEVVRDLSGEWLPRSIYGTEEYQRRVLDLKRRRYYSENAEDRAGILRYTKATDAIMDLDDIPPPSNERELAWLLSFYWGVDEVCNNLTQLAEQVSGTGNRAPNNLSELQRVYEAGLNGGLELSAEGRAALRALGIAAQD